jgi:hypothetical protein
MSAAWAGVRDGVGATSSQLRTPHTSVTSSCWVCGLAVLDDPHLETFDLREAQSVVELGVIVGVAVSVDECSWLVIDRGQDRSPCQRRNEAAIRVR